MADINYRMKSKHAAIEYERYFCQSSHQWRYRTGRKGNVTREEMESRVLPQAQHIIGKFGGVINLMMAVQACYPEKKDHWTRTAIYRWLYPVEVGGLGGSVPRGAEKKLLKAARYAGILLTLEDFAIRDYKIR